MTPINTLPGVMEQLPQDKLDFRICMSQNWRIFDPDLRNVSDPIAPVMIITHRLIYAFNIQGVREKKISL